MIYCGGFGIHLKLRVRLERFERTMKELLLIDQQHLIKLNLSNSETLNFRFFNFYLVFSDFQRNSYSIVTFPTHLTVLIKILKAVETAFTNLKGNFLQSSTNNTFVFYLKSSTTTSSIVVVKRTSMIFFKIFGACYLMLVTTRVTAFEYHGTVRGLRQKRPTSEIVCVILLSFKWIETYISEKDSRQW